MKKNLVWLVLFMTTMVCYAKEWRLTVLIDGAGLTKDAYGQIYKALTTEWPTQVYSLSVEGVTTKETVALQTVLFGVETYTLVANQFRFMPLSGQGKTVRDTEITIKDCAMDSLIDTIVERHKPLKDQFREQVESFYLATSDGVILLSLCPNLENFQNGISPEGKAKLQTIKLAKLDTLRLNSAVLSQAIKSARAAYDSRMTAAVIAPSNPDRMLERLADMKRNLDALQREVAAKTNQMEKMRKDLMDTSAQLDLARENIAKKSQAIADLNKRLLEKGGGTVSDKVVRQLQKEIEEANKKAKTAEAIVEEANTTIEGLNKEIARLKKLLPTDSDSKGTSQPDSGDNKGGGGVLITLLVLGIASFAAWIFWPRKKWGVTIERTDGGPSGELLIVGKAAKAFSSAGEMGIVGGLQIRYLRQADAITGEKKDVFQLRAPDEGWSVINESIKGGAGSLKKILLQTTKWSGELEANIRYSVYTDQNANEVSIYFTVTEQG